MPLSNVELRIGVLFGGRSAEHDVSVLSATNVMAALDPAEYDAIPIFITRDGRWLASRYADGVLAQPSQGAEVCLLPGGEGRMTALEPDETQKAFIHDSIYGELVHNDFREETRARYQAIIREQGEAGADSVALACTEIPLLLPPEHSPLPAFSTTELHCAAAVERALADARYLLHDSKAALAKVPLIN